MAVLEYPGTVDEHFRQEALLRVITHIFIWLYVEKRIDESCVKQYNEVIEKYITNLIASTKIKQSVQQPLVIFYSAMLIGTESKLGILKEYLLTITDQAQQNQVTRSMYEVYEE